MEGFLLIVFILGVSGLLIGVVFSSPVNATDGDDPQKEPRPDQWEDWETDRLNEAKAEDEEFWKAHYAADTSLPSPPPSVRNETDSEDPEYDSWLAEEMMDEDQVYEEEEQEEVDEDDR